jgi:hypothetical protein
MEQYPVPLITWTFQNNDGVWPQRILLQTRTQSPRYTTKENNYISKFYKLNVFVDLKFKNFNLDFGFHLNIEEIKNTPT